MSLLSRHSKTAMPRHPFKYEEDSVKPQGLSANATIQEILDAYDPQAFLRWIQKNSQGIHLGRELKNLEETEKLIYSNLLKELAPRIARMIQKGKHGEYDIPYPVCPSQLYQAGIQAPIQMVTLWPLEELVDEYFGICYRPSREGERFPSGIKEALVHKIKSMTDNPGDLLDHLTTGVESGMSVTDPEDAWLGLFDRSQLEAWWKGLSDNELENWVDHEQFDGSRTPLYRWCEEQWGGGLSHREVRSPWEG